MGYCGSCGAESEGWERYCRACGAELSGPAPGGQPTASPDVDKPAVSQWGEAATPTTGSDSPSHAGGADRAQVPTTLPDQTPPPTPSSGRHPLAWITATVAGILVLVAAAVGLTYELTRSGTEKSTRASVTTLPVTVSPSAPTTLAPTTTARATTATTQPAATFASLYQADVSGVVRIDATTCSGSGVGSGFLISPTLVATAAHVVDGAVAAGLTADGRTTLGHVIGINDAADVALLQTTTAFSGHVFNLASTQPPVGTPVGVIGFPEGGPVSFSQGSISGLDRSIDVQGQSRSGLMQTDAAINPGNSGGPVLLVGGTVVGLADAKNTQATGIGFAIPAAVASPLLATWKAAPAPPAAPACPDPLGPSGFGSLQSGSGTPAGVIATLTTYFDAIDSGDYATAYAQLAPAEQATISEAQFATNDATSYDYNVTLTAFTSTSPGTGLADVSFTSLQSPAEGPNGDQCDNWTLEYTVITSGGSWLIQSVNGQGGVTHASC